MATDLDLPPLFDPLTKYSQDLLSNVWRDAISTYHQTLTEYLSQFGIFLPRVTTAERNTIQAPVGGQIIYNTTIESAQYYNGGTATWTSF